MPPTVAGEERGRETFAHLAERFALADLHEGSIHPVRITVSRDTAPRPSPEEGSRC
jgi:hypothetical protein